MAFNLVPNMLTCSTNTVIENTSNLSKRIDHLLGEKMGMADCSKLPSHQQTMTCYWGHKTPSYILVTDFDNDIVLQFVCDAISDTLLS